MTSDVSSCLGEVWWGKGDVMGKKSCIGKEAMLCTALQGADTIWFDMQKGLKVEEGKLEGPLRKNRGEEQ